VSERCPLSASELVCVCMCVCVSERCPPSASELPCVCVLCLCVIRFIYNSGRSDSIFNAYMDAGMLRCPRKWTVSCGSWFVRCTPTPLGTVQRLLPRLWVSVCGLDFKSMRVLLLCVRVCCQGYGWVSVMWIIKVCVRVLCLCLCAFVTLDASALTYPSWP
jgi:hypothetical protein